MEKILEDMCVENQRFSVVQCHYKTALFGQTNAIAVNRARSDWVDVQQVHTQRDIPSGRAPETQGN